MKRQKRRGAHGNGELSDRPETEEERSESAEQTVARRQVGRTLATPAQDDRNLQENLMSRRTGENEDQNQLDRRDFLRDRGTRGRRFRDRRRRHRRKPRPGPSCPNKAGAGVTRTGATGAGAGPRRPASRFNRNFDPVPASEPSMNFAAFTDTHVGQSHRSPNWDYAQHLDKLADDIMERTLPCEFVVHLGTARSSHSVRQRRGTARQSEVQLQEQPQGLPDQSPESAVPLCQRQYRSHGLQPWSGFAWARARSVRVDEDVHQRNRAEHLSRTP